MISLLTDMGFIRYPLVLATLIIVGLALYSTVRLFDGDARADPVAKTWLDAILFWGAFALVTGVLGTLVGIVVTAQSIEAAGGAEMALVWGGVKVALYSSIFGVLILAASGLLWFGLQLRWRYLAAEAAPGA